MNRVQYTSVFILKVHNLVTQITQGIGKYVTVKIRYNNFCFVAVSKNTNIVLLDALLRHCEAQFTQWTI
mgnify:CR=1 FL=1